MIGAAKEGGTENQSKQGHPHRVEDHIKWMAQNLVSMGSSGKDRFEEFVSKMNVDTLKYYKKTAEEFLLKCEQAEIREKYARPVRRIILAEGGADHNDQDRIARKAGDTPDREEEDLMLVSTLMTRKIPDVIRELERRIQEKTKGGLN